MYEFVLTVEDLSKFMSDDDRIIPSLSLSLSLSQVSVKLAPLNAKKGHPLLYPPLKLLNARKGTLIQIRCST